MNLAPPTSPTGAAKKPTDARDKLQATVAAIEAMQPAVATIDGLRAILGRVTLRTLPEIASLFGVQANTVKQSWRQAGMPGETNRYDLAEVLAWKLARDQRNDQQQQSSVNDLNRKLKEAELRNEEAMAAIRELKFGRDSGNAIERSIAEAELATIIVTAREQIMGIARRLEPHFPREVASDLVEMTESECRRTLTQIGETDLAELMQRREQILNQENEDVRGD